MNQPAATPLASDSQDAAPPRILLLGTVHVAGADDALVEPTRRNRLTELAAVMATHPGCDHTTIDACYYPGRRVGDNARNTQISKLRRWLGTTSDGEDYLPRYHAAGGYRLHEAVTTDWQDWKQLLPNGAAAASDQDLEAALALIRGRPFEGTRARRYAWAEQLKQHMITAITTAAGELATRRIHARDWRSAEQAAVTGLTIEPGLEQLWRLRILAAHAAGHRSSVQEAIDRLMVIINELGGRMEKPTAQLLHQLQDRSPDLVIPNRLEVDPV